MNKDSASDISIKINPESDVPIYKQIAYGIETAVLILKVPPGSRMPTVRRLAELLRVDPNTVQKSYKFLKDEDVIYSKAGEGSFLSQNTGKISEIKRKRISEKLKELTAEAKAAGMWTEDLFLMIIEEYDK